MFELKKKKTKTFIEITKPQKQNGRLTLEIALCKWLDEQCVEQPLPICLINAEKKSRWGKPTHSYGACTEAPEQTSRFVRNPNSGVLPYSLK